MYHKEGSTLWKGKWSRRMMHDEWNREVCKMNLLGPLNASSQEVMVVIMEGVCSQTVEAFHLRGKCRLFGRAPHGWVMGA